MNSTGKSRIEKLTDLVALSSIDGIGPGRIYQLLAAFQTADRVLEASISELTDIPNIGRETASKIRETRDRAEAEKSVADLLKKDWRFYLYDDADYPQPLREIPDHPPFIFYLGDYLDSDRNAIAIVGSRSASEEGRHFAENLAASLTQSGVVVVSGMARGIDTSAHRGAINAGGRTIAVFGCSLDIIYPPESRELARKVIGSGSIFSEFLPGTVPYGPNFPKRNRLISGLSQGVVVIEAAERSGALSTAGHALAQNREVFAVPGSPRHEMSKGTNKLIKEGARLLTSIDDIFSELPRLKGQVKAEQATISEDLTDTEKAIVRLMAEEPIQIDSLSRRMNTPVPDLLQVLLALELKGLVKELAGKRYILN